MLRARYQYGTGRRRLVAAALTVWMCFVGAACSVVGSADAPERLPDFAVLPDPVVPCGDPAFAPNCGLTYTGSLTGQETLVQGVPPNETEVLRLAFDGGAQRFDLVNLHRAAVPLNLGTSYTLTVELTPTATLGYGSFTATDAQGLVFFATTSVLAADPYNPAPPAGWSVTKEAAGYDSYALGCGARGTPQVLVVEHGGERVRLVQGERKPLGGYYVVAFVAEAVDYAELDCLDYVAPELSYAIVRAVE